MILLLNDNYAFPSEDELKEMSVEERLEIFDRTFLSDEERKAIEDNRIKAEQQQQKVDKAYNGVMWGVFTAGISAIAGSPFGAIRGTASISNNLSQYNESSKEMKNINTERDDIRKRAQSRFEQAMNMDAKINYDGTMDDDYTMFMGRRRLWL